jgi:hypothetical protein
VPDFCALLAFFSSRAGGARDFREPVFQSVLWIGFSADARDLVSLVRFGS